MSKIGAIASCDNDIDVEATDLERKKDEVLWKVKLNDSKVEAASELGGRNFY